MTIRRSATQTRSAGVAAGEFRCNIMLVRLRSGVRILCAWESYCMIPLPRTRRCCWTLHTHVVCEIVRAEAVFGIVHTSTTMGCSLLLSNRSCYRSVGYVRACLYTRGSQDLREGFVWRDREPRRAMLV